ncbi:hypothetical protein [Streptomyces bullii]|uniref:Uncharacterized protein n=1 Tax=Streptomyces bullii TaxID=349910 RepID=A0ABW0UQ86_9ACTN
MTQPPAVPCNAAQLHRFGDLQSAHGPHEWIVQPGMDPVRCPGAGEEPADPVALRDRIAEVLADALKPRYGGPQHNTPGGLPLTATAEEIRLHRAQPLADAVLAVLPAPVDRAAAPVKQRADCTELEWAEQERARFERLYTRESTRADLAEARANNAARDVDIYRKRLERLGEGYTEQRQRADRAETEAERLRTDRSAVCICGHTEAQHFEDVCLACDCGDYLTPGAAREVIARWREAATRKDAAPVDRAAVLNEAADVAERVAIKRHEQHEVEREQGALDVMTQLRRMAVEAQQDGAPS